MLTPPLQRDSSSTPFCSSSAFSSYIPRNRKVYGCICISPNDKILLVKGALSGKWSLPKGHLEQKETDLQCALRELFEETGICPSVNYSYYKKFSASSGYFIFFFQDEPTPTVVCNQEISEARWFDFQDIKQLNCNLDLNMFYRWMKKSPRLALETPCVA